MYLIKNIILYKINYNGDPSPIGYFPPRSRFVLNGLGRGWNLGSGTGMEKYTPNPFRCHLYSIVNQVGYLLIDHIHLFREKIPLGP